MTLQPLLDAAPVIQVHAFAAMGAFALGLVQAGRAERDAAAPDHGLHLGRADGRHRRHVILDS
jgi:uncharacterized membrane protein